jgi:hypothetical protein
MFKYYLTVLFKPIILAGWLLANQQQPEPASHCHWLA